MVPLIVTRWIWLGYIIGFVTVFICQPTILVAAADSSSSASSAQIDPKLRDSAVALAKAMPVPAADADRRQHDLFLRHLREGDADALYWLARTLRARNEGDDRAMSARLWHALADGPAGHIPSAERLGFSYQETDKGRALSYFVMASGRGDDGDDGGPPHQAALYNAGRMFLELSYAASSLEYFRDCANVGKLHPDHATEKLTETCAKSYGVLSTKIRGDDVAQPGITDAAELFLIASLDEFPAPATEEHGMWSRGMEHLDKHAAIIHKALTRVEGEDEGEGRKGRAYLLAAQRELEQLRSSDGGKKMSELQVYLFNIIMGRIRAMIKAIEAEEERKEL